MKKGKMKNWAAATIVLTTMLCPLSNPVFANDDGGKIIAPPVSTTTGTGFSDLGLAEKGAQSSIQLATLRGFMAGDPDGTFRPLDTVSRREFAAVMVKVLHLPVTNGGTSSFADVSGSDWGLAYIEAVHQAGLMNGDGQSFHPNDPITREQMAVVLCKAAGLTVSGNGEALTFQDQDKISPWAKAYVETAAAAGLVTGDGTNFNPQHLTQRQEVAVVAVQTSNHLAHVIQFVQNGSVTVSGITYQVADDLKGIFANSNADALNGATIDARFDGNTLTKIDRLELTATSLPVGLQTLVFDGGGNTVAGDLVVNTGVVTVKNLVVSGNLLTDGKIKTQAFDHVQVQGTAQLGGDSGATYQMSNDQFQAIALMSSDAQLQITGNTSVAAITVQSNATISADQSLCACKVTVASGVNRLQLQAQVAELDVAGNPLPQITLNNAAKITNLVLPSGVKAADVLVDYADRMYQILQVNGHANPSWPAPQQPPAQHVVDKRALVAEIQKATALVNAAVPGTDPGDYPQSAIDAFNAAIQAATAVNSNTKATTAQVSTAVSNLKSAETTFENSVIQAVPLNMTLQNGAQVYVNPSLPSTSNQVELSAAPTPGLYMYDKQSLTGLISIQSGNQALTLQYDCVHDQYQVMENVNGTSTEVGDLKVTSSDNSLLTVSSSNFYDILTPSANLTQNSGVTLDLELLENGQEVSTVNVPVTVDTTAPQVLPVGSYDVTTSTLTVTTSENLAPNQTSLMVYGSTTGDLNDTSNVVQLINGSDYSFQNTNGSTIAIVLTDSGKSKISLNPGSQVRVVVLGKDYGWNDIDPNNNTAIITVGAI